MVWRRQDDCWQEVYVRFGHRRQSFSRLPAAGSKKTARAVPGVDYAPRVREFVTELTAAAVGVAEERNDRGAMLLLRRALPSTRKGAATNQSHGERKGPALSGAALRSWTVRAGPVIYCQE